VLLTLAGLQRLVIERVDNIHQHLMRTSAAVESTTGALYIDGEFTDYALEDTKCIKKVAGETRIPDGRCQIALRTEGGLTQKYAELYGAMHNGLLWLQGVPGFDWIYVHTGNKRGHTEGCLLVGDTLNNNQIGAGVIGKSRDAYQRIYPKIVNAIESGEKVTLRISNLG